VGDGPSCDAVFAVDGIEQDTTCRTTFDFEGVDGCCVQPFTTPLVLYFAECK
jgi:hypothetical protein